MIHVEHNTFVQDDSTFGFSECTVCTWFSAATQTKAVNKENRVRSQPTVHLVKKRTFQPSVK